jgi:multidrug efflux pump
VPKGFFPQQDTGRLQGAIQAAQDISFQAMQAKLTDIIEIVGRDAAVANVVGFTGGQGNGPSTATNTARLFVMLKPLAERKITADQVITRLRREVAVVPGAPAFFQATQDVRAGGRMGNAQYQYTLQGDDVRELNLWGPRVAERLRALPQLVDLNSDQQDRGQQSSLVIDRATASRLGITPQLIDDTLYDAFGQRQVAILYTPLNQYHVVMEVEPRFWQRPETLRDIYLPSSKGGMVPLGAFSRYEPTRTALAVNHQAQFPSVTLSFNLAPGVSLGDAVTAIDAAVRPLGLPSGIQGSFQGTAQLFQASLASQPLLIAAALLAVYVVLGVLYESYVHPLTILSTLPSAGVGALLALVATRNDLTVIALIRILLLVGIVKKNAIMMIDVALDAERSKGKPPTEAIYEACVLRFRPIMMTTIAALVGALPLALGTGIGAELRRPLGIAIVGGLIVSQALTLYTTPVVYLYLDRARLWWASRHAGHGRPLVPAASQRCLSHEALAGQRVPPPPAGAYLGNLRAHDRVHGRHRLRQADDAEPRRVQGARRLEDCASARRSNPWPVVGDLRRSPARYARGARQRLEPEPLRGRGPVPGGSRARARGPRGIFPYGDARARLHALSSVVDVRLQLFHRLVQRTAE